MEFTKGLKLASLLAASGFVLAACGGGEGDTTTTDTTTPADTAAETTDTSAGEETVAGELQDGTYTLEEENLDDNGWKTVFTMTVEGGEITESNYDNVNEEGMSKTEDQEYQDMMSEQTGVGPQDFIPELNNQLEETQDPSSVEVVSGATHSYESFVDYAQQLIDAAAEGNTDTIEINN